MAPKDLIVELDNVEGEWWAETIQEFRLKIIKEPKHYAREILLRKGITRKDLEEDIDSILKDTRESVWQMYLQDEAAFHSEVLSYLIKTRNAPKEILANIINSELLSTDVMNSSKEELTERVARIVGGYAGRVMPYIYALSLSTTQSRRSRAGKVFEHIIETFMELSGYPYKNQSALGTSFFKENDLGKKVDLIVPGADEYVRNRAKCAVITMKTSLRERWQEVAEELSRTNVPHIYLLTVDDALTSNVINTMKRYNITVVLYGDEKESKFASLDNVQDFRTFFFREMPHITSYWKANEEKREKQKI